MNSIILSEGSLVTDSVEEGDLRGRLVFRLDQRGKLRPTQGAKNAKKVEVESQFDLKKERRGEGKEGDERGARTGEM